MALDMGGVTALNADGSLRDEQPSMRPMPSLDYGTDIGAALKAIREHKGFSIAKVADVTRVRPAYLLALEDMRLEDLPSRPFTIGYIRAYAEAMGLDADAAVKRFRTDEPESDDKLRAPIGVRPEKDPRMGVIIAGGVLIIAAIVSWNVAQRAITAKAPAHNAEIAETPQSVAASATPPGQVSLGAPLPAPVESTTPTPYITPGLADAVAAGGSADAASAAAKVRAAEAAACGLAPPVNIGGPFKAEGRTWGSTQNASAVVLQARKGAGLGVRGADGAVYFARQLAMGEAYRVPAVPGVQLDVSDPQVVEVYVNGVLTGHLPATVTPLSKIAG